MIYSFPLLKILAWIIYTSLQQDQDLHNLNTLNLISTRETLQTGDVNPSKKAEYVRLSILNDH